MNIHPRLLSSLLLIVLSAMHWVHAEETKQETTQATRDRTSINITEYCEQLTTAQRNTFDAIYKDNCPSGFFKLMHGVNELEMTFDENLDYDLTPLCEFNKPFESLRLYGFNGDLPKCFQHIQGITLLQVAYSSAVDLSALSNNNLIVLSFESVTQITGILKAENLVHLRISNSNLSPSTKFIAQDKLDDLYLHRVNIKNLEPFRGFKNMATIRLSKLPELEDLSVLEDFTKLELLDIHAMEKPYQFPVLKNHPDLATVSVRSGYFDALEQLRYLTGLKKLDLRKSKPTITDISMLNNLTSLEYIDLSYHDVTDISPLAALPNIDQIILNLANPRLTDITNFYDIAQRPVSMEVYEDYLLSCSPQYYEEYKKGKRCNTQQRENCGSMKPGLLRKFCVFRYRDWF
jgi:Leucine-rich repeat (LRR) protein